MKDYDKLITGGYNDVLFTHEHYPELKCVFYIKGCEGKKYVDIMTKYVSLLHRRYDQFDWGGEVIKWIEVLRKEYNMRIAFVSESLAGGGSERQTVVLADAFRKYKKDTVYVITGNKKENEYILSKDIKRCYILKGKRWLLADAFTLLERVKKYQLDVIVGMGIYANLLVALTRLFGGQAKAVVSEMNDPAHDNLSYKSKFLRKILYWRADGFVFQTNEEKEYYSKKIQKRSTVIHNPVKADIPYKTNAENKEIIAIGRLMPQKNYPLMLKAFGIVSKKYPDYVLKIFGVGTEEDRLKAICRQLQIDNKVIFEGFRLDVHKVIADSDIYVISSDFEGMPNALMETMAMGFPVVAVDFYGGGARELIQDGVNGLLTPREDAQEMADRIMKLIENRELKAYVASNAIKVRETHSEMKISAMWSSYIHSIT